MRSTDGVTKMKKTLTGAILLAVSVGALTSAFTGCAPQPSTQVFMEGSRSAIYNSVSELSADATYVVTGEVIGQTTVTDKYDNAITLSELQIDELKKLGDKYTDGASLSVGGSVVIRQMGSEEYTETLSPLLTVGSRYLLFVNPTELPGEDSSQYFITGNTAGYYALSDAASRGSESPYEKVGDEGDDLPPTLTISDIK